MWYTVRKLLALLYMDLYIFWNQLLQLSLGGLGVALIMVFLLLKFPNKGLKQSLEFLEEMREAERAS